MDLGPLRALALDLNLGAHGVPVTVQPPYPTDGAEVVTRGIWVTQQSDLVPGGTEFQRREPRRVLVLRLGDVAKVPRGTAIIAPAIMGGPNRGWRVDGVAEQQQDHIRLVVVPDAALDEVLGVEP